VYIFASSSIIIQAMKKKADRLEAIKSIISSTEIGSQDELLQELKKQRFQLTQATLSRDLKQLKVAKATNINGDYVYVLPNDIMYKRNVDTPINEMMIHNGFVSLNFSGNLAVIKTKPGYASRMAYDIDSHDFSDILGTVAGDDTIIMVVKEHISPKKIRAQLSTIIPNVDKKYNQK